MSISQADSRLVITLFFKYYIAKNSEFFHKVFTLNPRLCNREFLVSIKYLNIICKFVRKSLYCHMFLGDSLARRDKFWDIRTIFNNILFEHSKFAQHLHWTRSFLISESWKKCLVEKTPNFVFCLAVFFLLGVLFVLGLIKCYPKYLNYLHVWIFLFDLMK